MPDDFDLRAQFSEHTLPHSVDAEQSVLGSIMMNPETISVAAEMLTPDAFYIEQHRKLFRLLIGMFGDQRSERLDIIVIVEESVRAGVFESAAEARQYLLSVADKVPAPDHIRSYCEIVMEKYLLRQISTVSRDLLRAVAEGTDPAATILDAAEQRIYDIREGRDSTGLVPIHDVVLSTYRMLDRLSGPDRALYVGAKSGFDDLDSVTNGLNRSDLIILAARPGMGKTSLALNFATNVSRRTGSNVVIYSLEMGMEQLVSRMLASEALVDSKKLRSGWLETEDWSKIAQASDVLSKMPILLSEAGAMTVGQMKAQLRRVRNLGLVVIDYLQLMSSPGGSDNRVQVISDITRNLKLMAKELNVPVLLLSQLNRGVESRTDKRPLMSDLRESGSIEQDADIILFLYNDYYYQKDKTTAPSITECIVAKNRHGETRTVKLVWDPQHTRFSSAAREGDTEPS